MTSSGYIIGEVINFFIQRGWVFRSKGNIAWQGMWYVIAFCIVTCVVNSINCIWGAVIGDSGPTFQTKETGIQPVFPTSRISAGVSASCLSGFYTACMIDGPTQPGQLPVWGKQ